jgi:hypothetical protein
LTLTINGRVGQILLYILGAIVGIGMVVGFALPAVLVGAWLAIGCVLALVGV